MMITKKQNADVNVSNIIIVDSPKPAEIIEDKGVGAKRDVPVIISISSITCKNYRQNEI